MTLELGIHLFDLASAQHGMLTTEQANRAGYRSWALARLVKAGELLHPGRGLYAVPALVDQSGLAWHRHLSVGGVLMYPDALLTGASALIARDLPVWGADLTRPRLVRPPDRSRGATFLWIRPNRGSQPSVSELGPTVGVADALVQHALDSGVQAGVVSADAAMHARLVTPEDIQIAAQRVENWPKGSRARSMTGLMDGRRESVAESLAGVSFAMHGILVEPQVRLYDQNGNFVARVDFLIPGTNVVVEVDGRLKYASGNPQVLWDEKRREDAIRRLGYVVVRLTWADLMNPEVLIAKVRAALAMAA